ncbi:MAG TPA: LLM class F420-dependent oxidoreductase [Pseudonocardia sp.]|jgi:probable F420-dependent oxidoreductase|uniref:LLM class F420-dependent oxidoreductase n=1 Tax=Pseudonocardia sp. TaxID=60912 RepID=UPI002F41F263
MSQVGVTLPFDGLPLHQHREAIERLADAGISEVSTGESNGLDALSPLLLAAAWRPELTLTAAVVSAFTRGPSIMASTAAALAEAAPGRARFGIGAGSDRIVEGWNGIPFTKPYSRVAHTLRVLRATLSGQRASTVAESAAALGIEDFKLGRPPERPPALVVAALGPRMQRLAAAEADGVVLNFLAASDVSTVRDAAAGVDRQLPDPLAVQARVFVVTGEGDPAELAARRMIAAYLSVPVYANFQRWLGRGEQLAEMAEAWDRGDRAKAVEVIPDQVVHDLFLTGSPRDIAPRVRAYLDAGVEIATLGVLPPYGVKASPSDQVDFLCELAAALWSDAVT